MALAQCGEAELADEPNIREGLGFLVPFAMFFENGIATIAPCLCLRVARIQVWLVEPQRRRLREGQMDAHVRRKDFAMSSAHDSTFVLQSFSLLG